MYEFHIMTPPNMRGRRKAMKYATMFGGKVYEDPKGNGYVVYFEVDNEKACEEIGRMIDKRELMPELPS